MLNFNPSFNQESTDITFKDVQKTYTDYKMGHMLACYAFGSSGNPSTAQKITLPERMEKVYYNTSVYSQITVLNNNSMVAMYLLVVGIMQYYRVSGSGGKTSFSLNTNSTGFTIPAGSLPSGDGYDFCLITLAY